MPLAAGCKPGDRLGAYEIVSLLGKGGMGEVWKAHDAQLGRDVAIKVSAEQFTDRFEREARAIASLNHSNVCTLYHIGPNYLVMELIEGPTLADRIADCMKGGEGPIPLKEALGIAKQIAAALEAAHEKNIVHRDLKPANVKIKPDGSVKVLDFGLAKSSEQAEVSADSPTMMSGTRIGMILGTAGYMAPEQARGKRDLDKRADIWAFGVVLYEMLTGKRLFQGEDVTQTLAAVIMQEPDLSAVPAEVLPLLKRCLEKDPKRRLRDIGDWELLLGEGGSAAPLQSRFGKTGWMGRVGWIGAAVFAMTTGALALIHFREMPPDQGSVRFQVAPPEKLTIQDFRLSPDGRLVAFTASDRKLWVRSLDSLQSNPLPGTDGASFLFWSPDSRFIGFVAQGKLKKVTSSGGPPQTICDAPNSRGGTWNRDGVILFAPAVDAGLYTVPAGGGVPVQVLKRGNSAGGQRYPEFLPDGHHFLFSVVSGKSEDAGIYAGSLDGKPPVRLLPDVSNAMYAPAFSAGRGVRGTGGYVLFRRGDTLIAQPFDPDGLRMSGDSFPVAERVGEESAAARMGSFSLSENGALAYGSGTLAASQLVWTDRTGKPMGSFGPTGVYGRFRLAPDEKRIVFDIANQDIWVLDAVRGVTSRLTSNPALNNVAEWSPDGLRVLFSSNRNGGYDLYTKSASGAGGEELVIKMGTGTGGAVDWSRDGRFILYQMPGLKTGQDLWVAPQASGQTGGLQTGGGQKPFPYLQTQFDEQDGQFSPDGKWVAYVSNESGRDEVYVQTFPVSGAKFQISSSGGSEPQWRNDGAELFYLATDGNLMAVPVKLGHPGAGSFQAGLPSLLMPVPYVSGGTIFPRNYAVSNDGRRFLIAGAGAVGKGSALTVILNWQAGAKK